MWPINAAACTPLFVCISSPPPQAGAGQLQEAEATLKAEIARLTQEAEQLREEGLEQKGTVMALKELLPRHLMHALNPPPPPYGVCTQKKAPKRLTMRKSHPQGVGPRAAAPPSLMNWPDYGSDCEILCLGMPFMGRLCLAFPSPTGIPTSCSSMPFASGLLCVFCFALEATVCLEMGCILPSALPPPRPSASVMNGKGHGGRVRCLPLMETSEAHETAMTAVQREKAELMEALQAAEAERPPPPDQVPPCCLQNGGGETLVCASCRSSGA
jgi:hypothetical protein